MFRVYRHSTRLSGSSGRKRAILEHRFITYRGLMYEFGNYTPNRVRVQDPLDPNYEYNTRSITRTEYVGESTCTYEKVMKFVNNWNMNYGFLLNNCQKFAKRLGAHQTAVVQGNGETPMETTAQVRQQVPFLLGL